jgi:hypothetical protein
VNQTLRYFAEALGHDGGAIIRPALATHTINDANNKCGWSIRDPPILRLARVLCWK